jgi:hypothetical protein
MRGLRVGDEGAEAGAHAQRVSAASGNGADCARALAGAGDFL